MTTAYVADGNKWNVTAPTGGLTKDAIYPFAGFAGVVANTVAAGATAVVETAGVFTVAKKAGAGLDFAVGEKAWALTTGGADKAVPVTGAGTEPLGYAYEAAATGATTVKVQLWRW